MHLKLLNQTGSDFTCIINTDIMSLRVKPRLFQCTAAPRTCYRWFWRRREDWGWILLWTLEVIAFYVRLIPSQQHRFI